MLDYELITNDIMGPESWWDGCDYWCAYYDMLAAVEKYYKSGAINTAAIEKVCDDYAIDFTHCLFIIARKNLGA